MSALVGERCAVKNNKEDNTMNLSDFSTAQLVEELSKREAVERLNVEPYEDYKITVGENEVADSGPAVILRIWD